jgi:hypothetical protein
MLRVSKQSIESKGFPVLLILNEYIFEIITKVIIDFSE